MAHKPHNTAFVAAPIDRRSLLQAAAGAGLGLTLPGLSLPGLYRAQEARATDDVLPERGKIRSCIFIFYYGGPSHLDTLDPKPDAPAEVRGEFQSIPTTVPGLHVSEHLPHLAQVMHKAAIVRSMSHDYRLHDSASIITHTGRPIGGPDRELFAPTPQFFPSHGGIVGYMQRERQLAVPSAAIPFVFHNVVNTPCQGAGFLGGAYDPLWVFADPAANRFRAESLVMPETMTLARLEDRRRLLERLAIDPEAQTAGPLEKYYDKAFQLLATDAVRRAIDLTEEDPRTRARYGISASAQVPATPRGPQDAFAAPMRGQSLLVARRMVEAGVPFINVHDFLQQGLNWDAAHTKNFANHKDHLLPPADRALAALITDLDERGLLDSTLVVATGEFGRTPRINGNAGRDHWPDCYSLLIAGGGVSGGAVYGASDKLGAFPAVDPVTPADLAATIFWRFGIDPHSEIHDTLGRPYRVAEGEPLRRLFGEA
ncbi:MAG: DUF1501 domain-containing protein [Planctomycetaceae bacterium]|nr:DUF1501 domain-containing protein [Planctomycetaceae bacterium]